MADLRERLTGDNLIEPLIFDYWHEVQEFIQDRACFCGGHLIALHAPNRKYTVHCSEHGPTMDHNHTSQYTAEQIEQNERMGKAELCQPKKPRPEKEILDELGF